MDSQAEKIKADLKASFEAMWAELYQWRQKHPEASFDEIGAQVAPRRRNLMGQMMVELATQHGDGEVIEGMVCAGCGAKMTFKGRPKREVDHLEGEGSLKRAYYYCDECQSGLFPPR